MKVAFHTLGCKVNTYETESVSKMFIEDGFERVSFKEFSDVYIINTCTVTNSGDSKSRKVIRQAIRRNPNAVIAVMGCYSQISSDEVLEIEGVDIIIGTKHRDKLLDYVKDYISTRKPIKNVIDIMKTRDYEVMGVETFTENKRAFLKIQEGCNNFCTFCIIPWARGLIRSRPSDDILKQIAILINNGYKEIVLTGIHTAGYGEDLDNYTFTDLLREILNIEGLERLRISSIEASQITDEIIEMIKSDKLARHIHIPIQSGSNRVLKDMRRKYTKEEFKTVIDKLRKEVPSISITTDVIVGFPGETNEEFDEMVNFIKDIKFTEMHIFPYSKRNGTPAARMPNQVQDIIKTMRVNDLMKVNEELALEYANKFLNKEISVIFESKKDDYYVGHASNYMKVHVKSDTDIIGTKKNVLVKNVGYPISYGDIV